MQSLKVRKLVFYTDSLFELQLERDHICFEPGNCLALFNEEGESRPYSIAAGTCEDVLCFLVRLVPDGVVSNWLARRKAGDRVQVSDPFGWFRPGRSESDEESVFIATGTGIAPFLSYLRSFPERPPLASFYGVSLATEAFALDELRPLPNFHLAVSREATANDYHGRVIGLLDRLPLGPQIHFYLCGLDAMIDDVSSWLEQHNMDYTQIHREVFFYADET